MQQTNRKKYADLANRAIKDHAYQYFRISLIDHGKKLRILSVECRKIFNFSKITHGKKSTISSIGWRKITNFTNLSHEKKWLFCTIHQKTIAKFVNCQLKKFLNFVNRSRKIISKFADRLRHKKKLIFSVWGDNTHYLFPNFANWPRIKTIENFVQQMRKKLQVQSIANEKMKKHVILSQEIKIVNFANWSVEKTTGSDIVLWKSIIKLGLFQLFNLISTFHGWIRQKI